jgi:hypothetical protein
MRFTFCFLFIFITLFAIAGENSPSSKWKLQTTANVSLNSNGMAPVPAFSLEKPAIMASLSLVKNRFSYEPTLAYGLDARPWFIDNWMHYKLIVRPLFELRTGFNPSAYLEQYKPSEEFIWHSQRYFTFELAGMYRFSPVNTISLLYWNDRGQETESMKGHYLAFFWDRSEFNLGKKVQMNLSVQLYYINYDGNNDGVFISPKISTSVRNSPFTLFFLANQAIQSNISPFPKFKCNLGIGYSL